MMMRGGGGVAGVNQRGAAGGAQLRCMPTPFRKAR